MFWGMGSLLERDYYRGGRLLLVENDYQQKELDVFGAPTYKHSLFTLFACMCVSPLLPFLEHLLDDAPSPLFQPPNPVIHHSPPVFSD